MKPNARLAHGGYSELELAPLRERYAVELAARFPSASEAEVGLLAHRQAQLAVLAAWMDRRGLLRNRQRGEPYPAVALHERISSAFERQMVVLIERERAAGGATPAARLEAHLANTYPTDGDA